MALLLTVALWAEVCTSIIVAPTSTIVETAWRARRTLMRAAEPTVKAMSVSLVSAKAGLETAIS